MFDAIRNFFTASHEAGEPPVQTDRRQLAQAALMFHVIAADGVVTDEERARFKERVASEFNLSAKETEALIEAARQADNEAIDLYAFTSVLKRQLDQDERNALIADLWEMVYADGEVHEFEDNIVWRIAELIGVESRERIELKHQIRDKRS